MNIIGTQNANAATPFGAAKPFGQPTTGLFATPAPVAGTNFGQNTAQFSGGGNFGQTAPATSQSTLFAAPGNTGTTNMFGSLTSSAPNTGFGVFGAGTTNAASGKCCCYEFNFDLKGMFSFKHLRMI